LAYLFISHDMSVVSHIADRIAVMYLGRIVESGPARSVLEQPSHPYTRALLAAVPPIDPGARRRPISVISGDLPSPRNPPSGCHYHPRCPLADARCRQEKPELRPLALASGGAPSFMVACHHASSACAMPAATRLAA
jgi:oligopeptide/dipeptide ABC transporter ATP-binding protein